MSGVQKSRMTDVKQHGIHLVNSSVTGDEFQVIDYKSENLSNTVKITVNVGKEVREVELNKDDMPHHSPMISFVQYPASVARAVKEYLNKQNKE